MDPLKPRHYATIPDLIRRDRGDLSKDIFLEGLSPRLAALDLLATGTPPVRPANPSLIPTADGPISRILLTIPEYAVEHPVMAAAYEGLLGSLPPETRIVVLVQEASRNKVEAWLAAAGKAAQTELDTFEDTLNISIWAEDGYVVAKDAASGVTYIVEPFSFPRYADSLVADFVENFTDLKATRAPLYFQGGNCLVGDDFFLIGADYPAISLAYIYTRQTPQAPLSLPEGMAAPEFVRKMYADYLDHQRKLVYVGSRVSVPAEQQNSISVNGEAWTEVLYAGNHKGTSQPLFHIDMFVTPVGRQPNGKYRLLVGDPRAAFQILGRPAPAHAMIAVFDDIADALAAQDFEVRRNPLPLAYMDDERKRERRWYFATSNNALVQNSPRKEVWLPTYDHGAWTELQKIDAENKKLWEEMGFTVHQLPDFHPFAEELGAVHCIKKYLARG